MGKEKDSSKKEASFEFCEVCRLNHDQGRRHRYLPRHKTALSSLLSRFLLKLSPLRSSLRHPSFHHHPQAPPLWCVFCSSDVPHSSSSSSSFSFEWEDAIRHLSGAEHLRKLKEFLWKHGGEMDKVYSFRVSEADLLKWEKKCEMLKASMEASNGPLRGLMDSKGKDIHNQFASRNVATFGNEMLTYFGSRNCYGVMPLQSRTNERCEPLNCDAGRVPGVASGPSTSSPYDSFSQKTVMEQFAVNKTVVSAGKPSVVDSRQIISSFSSSKMDENATGKRGANGQQTSQPFDALPRLDVNGVDDVTIETRTGCFNVPSSLSEQGKSQKLNPNRVGAAWAEKRRAELELEKKGLVVTQYDPNWLPDFGRVWQAGTRKESKKEFLTETKKKKKFTLPEISDAVQPYVSKRMRLESQENDAASANKLREGLPR